MSRGIWNVGNRETRPVGLWNELRFGSPQNKLTYFVCGRGRDRSLHFKALLNIFYAEPQYDRWFPFDRYPRRLVRRILRGKAQPGGHRRVFLNLCSGLDQLKVPYRINDFRYARNNPNTIACIIGKPFLLDRVAWKNPILFGAAVYSHPIDDPRLLDRLPVRKILVPGPWMELMCKPFWGNQVRSWPVGIDTQLWCPADLASKTFDVLIYDKVRWDHAYFETTLIAPIRAVLKAQGRSFTELRYGSYREDAFRSVLSKCRAMIFLCEHETQGIAYQQALSCGVPIFAWDRGGPWRDPSYYPTKVVFEPVTSVPYWDERCGRTFAGIEQFADRWSDFYDNVGGHRFRPRDYVLENLSLTGCASRYMAHAEEIA